MNNCKINLTRFADQLRLSMLGELIQVLLTSFVFSNALGRSTLCLNHALHGTGRDYTMYVAHGDF